MCVCEILLCSAFPSGCGGDDNDKLIKFSWAHYSLLGPESSRVGSGLQSRNPENGEVGRLDGCLESKFLLDIFLWFLSKHID